jgi:hypothetical protein
LDQAPAQTHPNFRGRGEFHEVEQLVAITFLRLSVRQTSCAGCYRSAFTAQFSVTNPEIEAKGLSVLELEQAAVSRSESRSPNIFSQSTRGIFKSTDKAREGLDESSWWEQFGAQ